MAELWPPTLPQIPMLPVSMGFADSVIRTANDVGPAQTRRRYTAMPDPLRFRLVLTHAQLQTFRTFWTTIQGRAQPFAFHDPETKGFAEMHFTALPAFHALGADLWEVGLECKVVGAADVAVVQAATGSALGTGTADGVSEAGGQAVGTATGLGTAAAQGVVAFGIAQGDGTAVGTGVATATGRLVHSGAGTALGAGIASATGVVGTPGWEFVNAPAPYVSTAAGTVHTLSFAVAASGASRKLIVAIASEDGMSISAATYNGIALTEVDSIQWGDRENLSLRYMDSANLPTDGLAHTLSVTFGSSSEGTNIAAVEYRGVAQGAAAQTDTDTHSIDLSSALSTSLTGVTAGALIVEASCSRVNTSFTPGASQVERHDDSGALPNSNSLAMSDRLAAAGTNAMTQTSSVSPSQKGMIAAVWNAA